MSIFGVYTAAVSNIHDGDTISVDIVLYGHPKDGARNTDLGFNIHHIGTAYVLKNQVVRLLGCNAPELATPDGKVALAYLQTILSIGDSVQLTSHGWDKYGGRIDGAVTKGTIDLSEAMTASGHAAPWNGSGTKPVPPTPPQQSAWRTVKEKIKSGLQRTKKSN